MDQRLLCLINLHYQGAVLLAHTFATVPPLPSALPVNPTMLRQAARRAKKGRKKAASIEAAYCHTIPGKLSHVPIVRPHDSFPVSCDRLASCAGMHPFAQISMKSSPFRQSKPQPRTDSNPADPLISKAPGRFCIVSISPCLGNQQWQD